MISLEIFFLAFLCIQLIHSIEELTTGFHRNFPLFKMPMWVFVVFEILFQGFFWLVFLNESCAGRDVLAHVFALLMFANGLWHMVWWGVVKKYVSGLITAPILVVTFIVFYFSMLT